MQPPGAGGSSIDDDPMVCTLGSGIVRARRLILLLGHRADRAEEPGQSDTAAAPHAAAATPRPGACSPGRGRRTGPLDGAI